MAVTNVPDVRPMSDELATFSGRPIDTVQIVSQGNWFKEEQTLRWVKPGDTFSVPLLRAAVHDLLDGGHFANARIEAQLAGDKVAVKVVVDPRRIVAGAEVYGAPVSKEELLDKIGVKVGGEIADSDLTTHLSTLTRALVERGYPNALVHLEVLSTDDPLGVLLHFNVAPGPVSVVAHRVFAVWPDPDAPGIRRLLATYSVTTGNRYDESNLAQADRALVTLLRQEGWHEAVVSHEAKVKQLGAEVDVRVSAGPKISLQFSGNASFDSDKLTDILELESSDDRSVEGMTERLRKHYVRYGFLDVKVSPQIEQDNGRLRNIVFVIVEGDVVKINKRRYPCLTGKRTEAELDAEIDSFLAEELPGSDILGAVDPKAVDGVIGPASPTGARPTPLNPNPYETYSARVYDRATKHLQDLYRAEGYLSATVGPVALLRRHCKPGSPPGQCIALTTPVQQQPHCRVDDKGMLLSEPEPDLGLGCVPDLKHGRFCESAATLEIPIKLGPRTVLWDVAFEGNLRIPDADLGKIAALELGEPLSLAEVEQARRRVLDEYTERGFAYADVVTQIEQSPDHSRARVRFSTREGEQVKIGSILIKGAEYTSEALIRSRIALVAGKPYRRSLVRATEERLGTLGVFSNIRVALEDPYIPAREKNVIVEVAERVPQYFEALPGFGTGEGPRLRLEFGNLNVGGKAVQFALRVRLSYLPDALILEPDVRAKYEAEVHDVLQRLERTISLSATFPDIGLGPQFRFGVEAFDVHDNARDYALSKDAAVSNLSYLLTRRLTLQLGGSLERNNVQIFGSQDQVNAIASFVAQNPGKALLFRVPAGTTGVVAERFTVNWDRRDMPFEAHRGTFVTSSLEHVTAKPFTQTSSADLTNPFAARDSDFIRFTSRVAGYVPLSKKGTTLAVSFRFGVNHQLTSESRTYPDRLFFMGGIDSLRGFLQDSLIPEDIARQVTAPGSTVHAADVLIRGGNFFVNPRAELRIPLRSVFQTVVFLDAGNLWSKSPTDPGSKFTTDYLKWRYATGTGLRVETPIGPLVLDYGFNIERVLDKLFPSRTNQRVWEDLGAFHFTIGLF